MADTTVQYVVLLLVQSIRDEVSLVSGLLEDLKTITRALEDIESNLKSVDKRAEEDDDLKLWVTRIRELVYEIEDLIEEYQFLQKKDALGSLPKQPILLQKKYLATTIEKICHNVADICRAKDDREYLQVQRSSPPVIEESELVGAESAKRQIMELIRVHDMTMKRETVAVIGMRGLGKTSVVGSVYNDPSVRHFFPIRAWIDASQPRNCADILTSILQQLYDSSRNMLNLNQSFAHISYKENVLPPNFFNSEGDTFLHELVSFMKCGQPPDMVILDQIRNYLTRKRYLVVFDDVQEDSMLVNNVKSALPANNEGSKILITTRYEKVACVWLDDSYRGLYKMKHLTAEKAWELFCKKTYQSEVNEEWPTGLCNLGRGIVDRCEGLPLGISVIGCLLSTKQNDHNEWRKVHDKIGLYLEKYANIRDEKYKILIRDFHNLEHYLKPCFLYFGLFPKTYSVTRGKLIRLWIAEGLIKKRGDLTLEEVAEEYINELINLSMVEVVSKKWDGKAKSLRVHASLHEMILKKLEEFNFCKILTKNHPFLVGNLRRLSIHKDHGLNSNEVLTSMNRCGVFKVRCLIYFGQDVKIFPNILTTSFLDTVHLLKVLDFCNASIHDIPDAIGNLLNLQYLSLRYTSVHKLPSSIGNLQNLLTLDLKYSLITQLPNEINRLHKLRHLIVYCQNVFFRRQVPIITMAEGELCNFRELQVLTFMNVVYSDNFPKELGTMKQMRRLEMRNLPEGLNANDLCVAIEGMTHLHSLRITAENTNKPMNFIEQLKSPPASLQHIYLFGLLKSFPEILLLQSLVRVELRLSRLLNSPLEILGGLPNLLKLKLMCAYEAATDEIRNVAFQKLKVFHLGYMNELRSFIIHKLAMPLLEKMRVENSKMLSFPTSIQFLPKLEKLYFSEMSESFNASIRSGGQYNSIVKHVPNVIIRKLIRGKWEEEKL